MGGVKAIRASTGGIFLQSNLCQTRHANRGYPSSVILSLLSSEVCRENRYPRSCQLSCTRRTAAVQVEGVWENGAFVPWLGSCTTMHDHSDCGQVTVRRVVVGLIGEIPELWSAQKGEA